MWTLSERPNWIKAPSLTSVQKYLERGMLYACIGLTDNDSNTKSIYLFSSVLTQLKGSVGEGVHLSFTPCFPISLAS